jgi:ATP-dependent Clp protease adaptor protein ClpS
MSTKTRKKVDTQLDDILSQPYVLILHNDDVNTFDWVIECLMKVCGHDFEQASQSAHTIHYTGKCDVKRGDKETIEKMCNKLRGGGLSATFEEA